MNELKNTKLRWRAVVCLFSILVFSLSLQSCNDTEVEYVKDHLIVKAEEVKFPSGASSQSVALESSVDQNDIQLSIAKEGQKWASVALKDDQVFITTQDNDYGEVRSTILTIIAKNQRQDVLIRQETIDFSGDIRVKVDKVTTTSELIVLDADGEVDPVQSHLAVHMIDNNPSTYHNSKVGAVTDWPFYYDFYFSDVDSINYIKHTSRTDIGVSVWGAIGEVEVWVATESKPELEKYGDYDLGMVIEETTTLELAKTAINPTHVQFRVKSGGNDRVSCAEMQFYQTKEGQPFDYLTIFADATCSELKAGITEKEISTITDLFFKNLAYSILRSEYNLEYRVREYRPYQHPNVMSKINKTSKYSLKDNATGIVAEEGKDLILFVGDTKKQDLSLNIRNYTSGAEVTYKIREGMNVIQPTTTGLMYIYNHTEDNIPLILSDADKKVADAKTVKINIYSGIINGLFDITKHDQNYWNKLLETYATYDAIDVLGIHSHVAWVTNHYREDKTDIVLMTNYIDNLVDQQKEFMGLYKYNKDFANRQYIRYDNAVPAANASDYRTAYNPSGYRNVFTTEKGLLSRMWVIGHEVGHTNQVRPGVKWAGTTEVTNNLYAMYNQKRTLGEAERLSDPNASDGYAAAFKKIIEVNNYWFLPEEPNNHIPKVAPFWQLYLYFAEIEGQTDFYKDLFEHFRTTKDITGGNMDENLHRELQFDFIRQVCRIGNTNMLDFFEKWGFLKVGDNTINDYGNKRIYIIQKQIDAFKAEINAKGYPMPIVEVHTITDENYKTIKK